MTHEIVGGRVRMNELRTRILLLLPALLSYDKILFETDGAVMTRDIWIIVVGTVAGLCTTLAFVPQVIKIWRQGGRDLSYGMLALYLIGAILWFIYGVLLHAQAVIITNFATAIVIALATAMKAWTARRDDMRAAVIPATERH
jgi:MtN3 and saliva related transmembrane protein